MIKVYFAGPDVFRYDAPVYFNDEIAEKCKINDIQPLFPLDTDLTDPISIFNNNIALIHECNVVLANLDPFRGASLDAGTAFEIGYATAIGKNIVGYYTYDSFLSYKDRMEPMFWEYSSQYPLIEDFDLSDNLMIIYGCNFIAKSLDEAIQLAKVFN